MRSGPREVCDRCGTARTAGSGVCSYCGYDQFTALVGNAEDPSSDAAQGKLPLFLAPLTDFPLVRFAIGSWGASPASALYQVSVLAVCSVFASLLLGPTLGRFYERPVSLGIALGTIAAALLCWHYQQGQYTWRELWRKFRHCAHWGWILVGAAIFLRFVLLQFWPPDGPGFEEREVGDIARHIMEGNPIQIAHRSANLMGALGLLTGGMSLEALRFYFQVAGGLSILVMALLLRRLSVGWPAVILAVFTMATLRWLVIAGGIADELFASVLLEMLLLYCLASSSVDRNSASAWAGLAGLCGGLLMYDYVSYWMVLAIPPAWWLLRAMTASDTGQRREILRLLVWYTAVFTIVAAPAIHSGITDSNSLLTEGLRRNREFGAVGLTGSLTISSLTGGFQETVAYVKLLAGWPEDYSPLHFRVPGKSVILPLVGGLFVAAWVWSVLRPAHYQLTRTIALIIAAVIIVLPFVTNTMPLWFTGGRLTPAIPLLILLLGIAVDDWLRLELRGRLWSPLRHRYSLLALAVIAIVAGNLLAIYDIATTRHTLTPYNSGPYFVCKAIADSRHDFARVDYYGWSNCTIGQDGWLGVDTPVVTYAPEQLLPAAADLLPETLVVNGHSHGLEADRIEQTLRLAADAGSLHTVRTASNIFGEIAAVSFCYQCGHRGPASEPALPRARVSDRSEDAAAPKAPPAEVAAGGADQSASTDLPVIVPEPADLDVSAVPIEHHAMQLVSDVSALIIPSPGARLVVHNNPDLLSRNGCNEAPLAPEGDTRLLIIHPSVGETTHSPFYLVGCSPGEATLEIQSDGKTLNRYSFTISAP